MRRCLRDSRAGLQTACDREGPPGMSFDDESNSYRTSLLGEGRDPPQDAAEARTPQAVLFKG